MKSLDPQPGTSIVPPLPAVLRPVSSVSPRRKGWQGRPPLAPGTIILADHEKQALQEVGWKEGQAIPGNLGQLLQRARAKVQHEIQTTPADTKPDGTRLPPGFMPNIPATVDINDLDAEKRGELEQYLNEFQAQAPAIERAAANPTHLTPGVQKALDAMGMSQGIEVVDSREPPNPYADMQKKIDEAEGRVRTESELVEDVEEPEPDDGIDHDDKVGFLIALETDEPFRKAYKFFGGRVSVVFRQTCTERAEWVIRALPKLEREGVIDTRLYMRTGHLYRMVLSLDTVRIKEETWKLSDIVDEGLALSYADFPDVYNTVRAHPFFNNESIWNVVKDAHTDFEKLLMKLETKATDSDFWDAIEG